MTAALRMLVSISTLSVLAQLTLAQGTRGTTITEPGVYELSDLFKQADTVALVKVVAGDTETYGVAVYKAEVVKSFKGPAVGETIYFGPFLGERLGWEYFLFLHNVAKPIGPKTTPNSGYGTVHYSEVFNEGYSSMMASYECFFDGKDAAQKCDHGVRVCTDYIRLPKAVLVFPPVTEDTPFGCRWVREPVFVSLPSRASGLFPSLLAALTTEERVSSLTGLGSIFACLPRTYVLG